MSEITKSGLAIIKTNPFNLEVESVIPVDTYYDGTAMSSSKIGGLYSIVNNNYVRLKNIEVRLSRYNSISTANLTLLLAEMQGLGGGRIIVDTKIYITSSITIPNKITLVATSTGNITINSGITVTANCYIQQGALTLFTLADSTSVLTGSYTTDKSITASSGTWSVTTGTVLTAATATYSKIDKQVALSGSFTFATAATAVTITLPYAPDYGTVIVVGNLTFVFTSGSTTATVTSSAADTENFQINYKTA